MSISSSSGGGDYKEIQSGHNNIYYRRQ